VNSNTASDWITSKDALGHGHGFLDEPVWGRDVWVVLRRIGAFLN